MAADFATGQMIERFIAPDCFQLFKQLIVLDNAIAKAQAWAPAGLYARRVDSEKFPIEATFSPLEANGERFYTNHPA
jgi:hypothetical protein